MQKFVVQLLIAGGHIVGRAFINAWRQAAAKGHEIVPGRMRVEEAKSILGITGKPSATQIQQQYDTLFRANATTPTGSGSLYLQGKILGAKNTLDEALRTGKLGSVTVLLVYCLLDGTRPSRLKPNP